MANTDGTIKAAMMASGVNWIGPQSSSLGVGTAASAFASASSWAAIASGERSTAVSSACLASRCKIVIGQLPAVIGWLISSHSELSALLGCAYSAHIKGINYQKVNRLF